MLRGTTSNGLSAQHPESAIGAGGAVEGERVPNMALDSASEVRILRLVDLSEVCSLRVSFRPPGWMDA